MQLNQIPFVLPSPFWTVVYEVSKLAVLQLLSSALPVLVVEQCCVLKVCLSGLLVSPGSGLHTLRLEHMSGKQEVALGAAC